MVNLPKDLPPALFLEQVVQHYPEAAYSYLQIWRERDEKNSVRILKNNAKMQFLKGYAKLRNDLLKLVNEGLVSLLELHDEEGKENGFEATLIAWEEFAENKVSV